MSGSEFSSDVVAYIEIISLEDGSDEDHLQKIPLSASELRDIEDVAETAALDARHEAIHEHALSAAPELEDKDFHIFLIDRRPSEEELVEELFKVCTKSYLMTHPNEYIRALAVERFKER